MTAWAEALVGIRRRSSGGRYSPDYYRNSDDAESVQQKGRMPMANERQATDGEAAHKPKWAVAEASENLLSCLDYEIADLQQAQANRARQMAESAQRLATLISKRDELVAFLLTQK